MGGLIERCAREFVAAATDLALDVGFAGLVARWRETEMGPNLSRASEPIRTVDCRAKCQRGNRTRSHVIMPISVRHWKIRVC